LLTILFSDQDAAPLCQASFFADPASIGCLAVKFRTALASSGSLLKMLTARNHCL
jgi:hypothetical protein